MHRCCIGIVAPRPAVTSTGDVMINDVITGDKTCSNCKTGVTGSVWHLLSLSTVTLAAGLCHDKSVSVTVVVL